MRLLLDMISNWVGRIFYPAYYDINYEDAGEDVRPWRIRESKDDD